MKKEIYNIAVVGLRMGNFHMQSVKETESAHLYGICDTDEALLEEKKEEFSPEVATTDWHDFLNDPKLDAVILATPDQLHLEMTKAFLEAGKHVLCEKPMALTVAECEEMMKAEKNSDARLMVGQVSRFTPAFAKTKELIESGAIGELYFIESEYAHDYSKSRGANDWRVTPNRHAVIGGGCHAIDFLRWIAGDPTEVYALSSRKCLTDWPVDDCSIAVMKFPNGVNGKVLTSIGCKRNYTMRSCFYGTKGTIICDNTSDFMTLFNGEGENEDGRAKFTIPQEIPVERNNHNTTKELEIFLTALKNDEPFAISPMEGASTVAVCAAVVESCATGLPAKVKYPCID